jgi:stage III sporulation protein AH
MKRKQIIVLGLVLVIIAVGIIQYNYGGSGESSNVDNPEDQTLTQGTNYEDIPGAAVYVDGAGAIVADDTLAEADKTSGFFAEARLERDKVRSKQKEELKAMTEVTDKASAASSTLTSTEASTQLVELIKRSEIESSIETLIKQRGFEDALAYMSDTGNIDVMVKAESLSEKEVAQISDIVVRHADVGMDNITVKNVN